MTRFDPESDTPPRIAIFLCRCGKSISSILDLEALAEEANKIPGVVHVQVDAYPCIGRGLASLKMVIQTKNIHRVVVAGCTPRTHRRGFRQVLREIGLHPGGLEMVNLREHCAWAHREGGSELQQKALDLLRMGAARSMAWKPSSFPREIPPRTAAVIGAGISGLTAANILAGHGCHVTLLEKEATAGGLLGRLYSIYPSGDDPAAQVQKKLAAIRQNPFIELRLGASINKIVRTPTGYRLYMESGGDGAAVVDASLILLATGARLLGPSELEGWDGPGVISLLDLEKIMRGGNLEASQVVMVLCAGARCEQRSYCARFCCMAAIKNARILRKQLPPINVTILCRDLSVNCINPSDIRNAIQEGVRFVRYDPTVQPRLGKGGSVAFRSQEGEECQITCNLAVPVTPMVSFEETGRLARMMGLPVDAHGFVGEPHAKLRPEWPLVPGAAVAGAAHWPCSASEATRQAMEAASAMARWLDEAAEAPEAIIASVDTGRCIGCGLCVDVCPFNAAAMTSVDNEQKAFISAWACRGCGICSAGCPGLAITLYNHTDEQMKAMIRALDLAP
jgi:heterodisulfide reductase subunit A